MRDAENESLVSMKTSVANAFYIESPLVVGFGIQLFWIFVLFVQLPPLLRELHSLPLGFGPQLGAILLLVFAAVCLTVGFNREKITFYLRRKMTHFLIGAIGASGTLLASLPFASQEPATLVPSIAGMLIASISCALSTLLWGEAARRRDQSTLAIATIISFAIAAALVALVTFPGIPNPLLFAATTTLSPLVSIVFVYKAQHDNESYFKPQEFVDAPDGTKRAKEGHAWVETLHELSISRKSFAFKLGKSAIPFGMICAGLVASNPWVSMSGLSLPEHFIQALLPFLAIALFIVLFFHLLSRGELPYTSRMLSPFFIVFLLFSFGSSLLFEEAAKDADVFNTALLALACVMIWLYPAELTKRYRISSMITFGYYAAFLAIGAAVFLILDAIVSLSALPPYLALLAYLVLFVIGSLSLMTDEQMRKISLAPDPSIVKSAQSSDFGQQRAKANFVQRCQLVADTFLLSHRELEILFMLAKGRNAAYIQKELVISEGTVRTHMRNIYRKLSVHSQQELIDLVDGIATAEEKGR